VASKPEVQGLLIRTARLDEREALEALQWRASLANAGDRDVLLAHPDAIELPSSQIEAGEVFVAEHEGNVLGFAAILNRDDGDIELDGLFVEPEHWQRGIGRALVEHCADIARDAGARHLHVIGNSHAEGFYQRCGFETIGVFQTRFSPGLEMTRVLEHAGPERQRDRPRQ
jgi:N-acetylglutamate synthase-like GNAT family acetyltransferase